MLVRSVLLSVVLFAVSAPAAVASQIVFVCGADLCAANPETGERKQLTTDGAASPYTLPSVSRDGRRLAAARGNDVMVGDTGSNLTVRWAGDRHMNGVALSPDGNAVAESHSYVENRYGCPLTGGCLQLVDMSAASFTPGSGAGDFSYAGGAGVGFLGNGALLSSFYTIGTASNTICVVAAPGTPEQPCEPRITRPTAVAGSLSSPAGSPDSTLIAASVGDPPPAATTSVQLFDAATGAPVRKLADNAGGATFSPDGSEVAYTGGDGWIYAVPVGGGSARRLVEGHSPTWGDGDPPGGASAAGARVASRTLRYRGGKVAVRVRCAGVSACRGTLRLRKGSATLGSRAYRIAAGRSATVSVRPSSRGRRSIARARSHRVSVQLRPASGTPLAKTVTLRR